MKPPPWRPAAGTRKRRADELSPPRRPKVRAVLCARSDRGLIAKPRAPVGERPHVLSALERVGLLGARQTQATSYVIQRAESRHLHPPSKLVAHQREIGGPVPEDRRHHLHDVGSCE